MLLCSAPQTRLRKLRQTVHEICEQSSLKRTGSSETTQVEQGALLRFGLGVPLTAGQSQTRLLCAR